jgi:hypothetical protein
MACKRNLLYFYYVVKSSGYLTRMLLNITSERPKIEQNQKDNATRILARGLSLFSQ